MLQTTSASHPALRTDPARVLGAPTAFSVPRSPALGALTFVGWLLADALGEEHGMDFFDHVRIYLTLGGRLVVECTAVPSAGDHAAQRVAVVDDLAGIEAHLAALRAAGVQLERADTSAVRQAMQRWPLIDASAEHVA